MSTVWQGGAIWGHPITLSVKAPLSADG